MEIDKSGIDFTRSFDKKLGNKEWKPGTNEMVFNNTEEDQCVYMESKTRKTGVSIDFGWNRN